MNIVVKKPGQSDPMGTKGSIAYKLNFGFTEYVEYTCPRCGINPVARVIPAQVSSHDPLAQRRYGLAKCKCFGIERVYKSNDMLPTPAFMAQLLIGKLEAKWESYGPPQHGKTREEWIKFMWNFEQRGKA